MKSRRLWVASLIICVVLGLVGLIGTSPSFEKCEHERKNHHAYSALHEKERLFIKPIVRFGLHIACARQTASENDGAIAGLSGIAVALFTLALWISTEKLWKVANEQSADAKRAIDVAERTLIANERAWITAEIHSWDDLGFYPTGNADLFVTFLIKNIGKTPAINVHTSIIMIEDAFEAPSIGQEFAIGSKRVNITSSRVLMPQQTYERKYGIGIDMFKREKGDSFLPAVMACVTYQVLPDLSIHQTLTCYHVSQIDRKGSSGSLLIIGRAVSKNDLEMSATSGGWAN